MWYQTLQQDSTISCLACNSENHLAFRLPRVASIVQQAEWLDGFPDILVDTQTFMVGSKIIYSVF